MTDLHLLRDERPIEGRVFVAMPYGIKTVGGGTEFDFDQFYQQELSSIIEAAGMTAVRADSIYGPQTVMGPIWRGIQQAEVVLIDFTTRSPNVAMEFAFALLIGKKMIFLTQQPDDIPTDVRGRLRHITYSAHFSHIHAMRDELTNQLGAIRTESTVEMALVPMVSGGTDPVPARVITVTGDFVVVEANDGRRGVLGNADVDYDRIVSDMTRRFTVGEMLSGAFDVDTGGGMKYTLLAGKADPWPQLKRDFPVGTSFTGTVRRVSDQLGAFVPLAHGIEGLLHRSTLEGRDLAPGDEVAVQVSRLDVGRRRIGLELDRVVSQPAVSVVPARRAGPDRRVGVDGRPEAMIRAGDRLEGEVVKVAPEGAGGFLLLRLPGRIRPAMLHCTVMTPALREDLNSGRVEQGEIIDVEVLTVDQRTDRVTLRDLPDEADGGDVAGPELAQAS